MSWQRECVTEAEEVQILIRQAAKFYGVEASEVAGFRRFVELVEARHAVCCLLRKRGWAYKRIGRLMGLDHTSAMHACTKSNQLPLDRIEGVEL